MPYSNKYIDLTRAQLELIYELAKEQKLAILYRYRERFWRNSCLAIRSETETAMFRLLLAVSRRDSALAELLSSVQVRPITYYGKRCTIFYWRHLHVRLEEGKDRNE